MIESMFDKKAKLYSKNITNIWWVASSNYSLVWEYPCKLGDYYRYKKIWDQVIEMDNNYEITKKLYISYEVNISKWDKVEIDSESYEIIWLEKHTSKSGIKLKTCKTKLI